MKKQKLQHNTLKLNKGRIADLQSRTILAGEDRGGKNKDSVNNCVHSVGVECTASLTSMPIIDCPVLTNTIVTY